MIKKSKPKTPPSREDFYVIGPGLNGLATLGIAAGMISFLAGVLIHVVWLIAIGGLLSVLVIIFMVIYTFLATDANNRILTDLVFGLVESGKIQADGIKLDGKDINNV